MSRFLTPADLAALTGYKQRTAQVRWLIDHGYRFDTRADGSPGLLWAQVEARQAVKGGRVAREPDFGAVT